MRSINSVKPCTYPLPFPKLQVHNSFDSVYLMTSKSRGTLIHQGEGSVTKLGTLVVDIGPSYLTDFTGSICLDNEK